MFNKSSNGAGLAAFVVAALFVVTSGIALAQTSGSFDLEKHSLNSGGSPSPDGEPSSASFRISMSSLGEAATETSASSSSFSLDSGFSASNPPPGEVAPDCGTAANTCLLFTSSDTLTWPIEPSSGVYNLYRDLISDIAGLGFGQCEQPNLTAPTAVDSDSPPTGDGFFYLVTVENLLGEEGTKGFEGTQTATERTGTACP